MTKVFVVILNWNQPALTLECLGSVAESRITNHELNVIVVDNGSTDDSLQKFRNAKFLKLKILENKENLGFALGNDIGIKYAVEHGADYVLVLNNDILVDKNLVVEMLKTAKRNKKVGIVSPKIYFAKGFEFHKKRYKRTELGHVIWFAGGEMDWNNVYGKNRGVDEVDDGQYDKEQEVDFATGACELLNAKALRQTGFYDPAYFMYLEDADLSMEMGKRGWKIVYSPKSVIWHKVAQSSGIGSNLNDYFISRNRLIFGYRWASARTKFALFRESIKHLFVGRKWQRKGVIDYYTGRLGRGSWK